MFLGLGVPLPVSTMTIRPQELNAAGAPFVLGGVRPQGVRTEDRAEAPHKDESLGESDGTTIWRFFGDITYNYRRKL